MHPAEYPTGEPALKESAVQASPFRKHDVVFPAQKYTSLLLLTVLNYSKTQQL